MSKVINIAVPVIISILLVGFLYVLGPHSKGWKVEKPVHWSYVEVTDEPLTYNEDGPYIETYSVLVDPENKCTAISMHISGNEDIVKPEGELILTVGENEYVIIPASFEHFKQADNSIDAYRENVKDDSKVYTSDFKDGGLSLRIIVPNKDFFRDPQNIRESDIGLTGVTDVNGGQMKNLTGHSDWMFMERESGIVPQRVSLSANVINLMDGFGEGDDVTFYLSSDYDDIELLDIDNPGLYDFINQFSVDGLTADLSWELDKKNDRIIVTMSNIRDITDDTITIHVPNGLAHGYMDGIYYSSEPMDIPVELNREG